MIYNIINNAEHSAHSSLVVQARLFGWTLSGQLGHDHDHAIFSSDIRAGNNP